MSKIVIFLFVALVAIATAFPAAPQLQDDLRVAEAVASEPARVKRGYGGGFGGGYGHGGFGGHGFGGHGGFHGHHGGFHGHHGYGHRGYGHGGYGHGGYGHGGFGRGGFGGGAHYPSFASSAANAGSISTPFGSGSFSQSFANSG